MPSTNSTIFFIVLILMQQHNGCYADSNEKEKLGLWDQVKKTYEVASENEMLTFGLKTVAVASTVIAAAPVVVGAAGFGAAGIVAGSAASTVQAAWFGGAITGMSGAAFGALQSVGAAGLGLGAKTAVVAATGATLKALNIFSESDNKDNSEEPVDNNKHSVEF